MRLFILLLLQFVILLPLSGYAAEAPKVKAEALQKAAVARAYGKLPLYFIRNDGQVDSAVRFYERGAVHSTFFTANGLVLALAKDKKVHAVRLSFAGADKGLEVSARSPLETKVNYFTGKDSKKWRSDVPVYGSIIYKGVYKNIDIKFYGNNRKIEHDIIVKAGGDPDEVVFTYDGVKSIDVTDKGELDIALAGGRILEKKPFIYQDIDGVKVPVKGGYRIIGKAREGRASYGFTVASYDHSRALVIDPVLDYSTYLGGSASDFARDIAMDASGASYITGWTMSADFPVLTPAQGVFRGGLLTGDAFITKINPAGTAVVYSTYLGGSGDEDSITIAVDATGAAYITGDTGSFNFPVFNAFQGAFGGGLKDAFVAKLSPAGNALVFSTYLGGIGDDNGKGLALDSSNAIYLTGWTASPNFPLVTPIQGIIAGLKDAYVVKMAPAGRALNYSTFLGGSNVDSGRAITVDATGAAYVAGHSWSFNFPLLHPIQAVFGGIKDVVVFKVDPTGTSLVFSTFIGGSAAEKSKGIALDSVGSIFVTGWTASPDFPLVTPIQGAMLGIQDAFVVKLAPPGRRIIYSTYLGGSDSDSGRDIAVDSSGAVYVVGHTWSFDFPIVNPLQGMFGGIRDAYVTKIDPLGASIIFSTFLGGGDDDTARGVAIDTSGAVHVVGGTYSLNFPIVNPIQGVNAGLSDFFVAKIRDNGAKAVTLSIIPDVTSVARGGSLGYTVTAVNTTSLTQCVRYWENITLPGGIGYPPAGELFGPFSICLNANTSTASHLVKAVPVTAPVGTYVLNAFVGVPYPVVMNSAGFNFNMTAVAPLVKRPNRSWGLLENGFIR